MAGGAFTIRTEDRTRVRLRLMTPERSLEQLSAIAKSGLRGAVQARQEIARRKTEQLRAELRRGA